MGTKEQKNQTGKRGSDFLLEARSQKAILCLHSIMALRAVITAKDI